MSQAEQDFSESSPLVTAMNTLGVLLNAVPETEVRLYSGITEVIYFEIDRITEDALVKKVEQASLGILPVTYRESRIDNTPERDYIVIGIATPTQGADIRFGMSLRLSKFVLGAIKDFPDELLFVAIETPIYVNMMIDIVDDGDESTRAELLIGEYVDSLIIPN